MCVQPQFSASGRDSQQLITNALRPGLAQLKVCTIQLPSPLHGTRSQLDHKLLVSLLSIIMSSLHMFWMMIWPLQYVHAIQHNCLTTVSSPCRISATSSLLDHKLVSLLIHPPFPTALSQLQTHLRTDNELPSIVLFALCAARPLARSLHNYMVVTCLVDAPSFTHPPCLLVPLVLLKNLIFKSKSVFQPG